MNASNRKPKSPVMASIHEAMTDLYEIGGISKATMRNFDRRCLKPAPEYKAEDVKRIRKNAHVSQAVLAEYMGVSVSTVQKWEAGDNNPHGPAARLLEMVENGKVEAFPLSA
jgi:putative transcriptional regulator